MRHPQDRRAGNLIPCIGGAVTWIASIIGAVLAAWRLGKRSGRRDECHEAKEKDRSNMEELWKAAERHRRDIDDDDPDKPLRRTGGLRDDPREG